jgi:hypothetical protein
MPGEETIRGGNFGPVDFVVPGLDVDEGELAFFFRTEAWQDHPFVDLVSPMDDLVWAAKGGPWPLALALSSDHVRRDLLQLIAETLLGMPEIEALLHAQPDPRAVTTELPQAHCHFRADG